MRVTKCIVDGCTSAEDERNFKKLRKDGPAFCPLHSCSSNDCKCTRGKKLFSCYRIPTRPDLRRIWYMLLDLPEEYVPSASHVVCSKHFEFGQYSRWKVPTLNIGKTEAEVQQIMNFHINEIIEEQELIQFSNRPARQLVQRDAPDPPPVIDRYGPEKKRQKKHQDGEEIEEKHQLSSEPQPKRARVQGSADVSATARISVGSRVVMSAWTKVVKEEPEEPSENGAGSSGSAISDFLTVKAEPDDV